MGNHPKKNDERTVNWKLKDAPTAAGVAALVEQGVLTAAEGRVIVVEDTSKGEKIKALEEQVEFLKSIVEKLSSNINQPQVVYKYIHDYRPTRYWGDTYYGNTTTLCSTAVTNLKNTLVGGGVVSMSGINVLDKLSGSTGTQYINAIGTDTNMGKITRSSTTE